MNRFDISVLAAVAGGTILPGPPFERLRAPSAELRSLLTATGIPLSLLCDVLGQAMDPIRGALNECGGRRRLVAVRRAHRPRRHRGRRLRSPSCATAIAAEPESGG